MNASDFADMLNITRLKDGGGEKMSPAQLLDSFKECYREMQSNDGIIPEQLWVVEREKDLRAVIAFLLDRLGGHAEISAYDLTRIYDHSLRFEKDPATGAIVCKLGNVEALEPVAGIDL